MHISPKTFLTYGHDYTEDFDTQTRSFSEVVTYYSYFVDPQYGCYPYWDEDLYYQDKLEYKDTHNKLNDQNESNHLITDSYV